VALGDLNVGQILPQLDPFVVVIDGDRYLLLGFFLADDVLVKGVLDLLRGQEINPLPLGLFISQFVCIYNRMSDFYTTITNIDTLWPGNQLFCLGLGPAAEIALDDVGRLFSNVFVHCPNKTSRPEI
jgi:hypothetical protein